MAVLNFAGIIFMNFIKRHPLVILILFIAFGIFAGGICADSVHQKEVERMYRDGLIPEPYYPKEEGYYGMLALYEVVGSLAGFGIGIIGYVVIKRGESESAPALNLGNQAVRK